MSREHSYNAGDEDDVRVREKADKDARNQELDDVRQIVGTKAGQRFVNRMLAQCGVYRISYTGNAEQAVFAEGQRNIGLMLLADLEEADPDAFPRLIRMRHDNG